MAAKLTPQGLNEICDVMVESQCLSLVPLFSVNHCVLTLSVERVAVLMDHSRSPEHNSQVRAEIFIKSIGDGTILNKEKMGQSFLAALDLPGEKTTIYCT